MNAQSVNPEQTEQIRQRLAEIRDREKNGTLFEPIPKFNGKNQTNPRKKERNWNKSPKSAVEPKPNTWLKACRICGHQVSINAKICPGCGEKNPVPQGAGMLILKILVFLGCLPLFAIAMYAVPGPYWLLGIIIIAAILIANALK